MPTYELTGDMFEHSLPLTRQHYEAIGLVAATWQLLEAMVQVTIWSILSLDPDQGKLLTASLRFDSLLDVLAVISHIAKRLADQPIDVSALIAETKILQGERNTIVHAIWDFSGNLLSDLVAPAAVKLKIKAPKDPPKYSPEQIRDVAQRITSLRLKWLDLVAILEASRQKSSSQNPPQEPAA